MGRSYGALLKSAEMEEHAAINDYIFTELTYHDVYNPMHAIRSKKYKYIKIYEPEKVPLIESIPGDIQRTPSFKEWVRVGHNTTRDGEEFYDLESDPLEEHNLAVEQPDHPELLRLKAELDKFLKATDDAILEGPYPIPDGATINNADDFDHIPAFFVATKGLLKLDDDGLVALRMQLSPSNPELYDIPAVEFLEEYIDVPVELTIAGTSRRGRITSSDEGALAFTRDSSNEQSTLSELVSGLLVKNVSLTVSRMQEDSPFAVTFKIK